MKAAILCVLGFSLFLCGCSDSGKKALEAGVSASSAGEYEKAVSSFSEAIRLDSRNADAYYGRAYAYGRIGEQDKAIADYDEAIRLDSRTPTRILAAASPTGERVTTRRQWPTLTKRSA